MTIERIVVGPLATNCYLLGCETSGEGIIIDPGGDADVILKRVKASGLKVTGILNTHGHFDHIAANSELKNELNVPIIRIGTAPCSWERTIYPRRRKGI